MSRVYTDTIIELTLIKKTEIFSARDQADGTGERNASSYTVVRRTAATRNSFRLICDTIFSSFYNLLMAFV